MEDDNLYSRQKAVFGAETMAKLIKLKIFLHGLRGVGIETAKNLILAGPAQVTLHDDDVTQVADLGTNFYLTQQDVGKNSRATASATQLQELNNYVKVKVHSGDITTDILDQHDVIIISDYFDKQKLIEWNDFCRQRNKGFIYCGNLGLYGFAFVDYGDKHTISDKNGEEVRNCIVVNISQDETGLVVCHEDKRHGFEDDDWVTFREVQGMDQVNGKLFKIKVKSPFSFTLHDVVQNQDGKEEVVGCDTRKFSPYQREGIVEQVKVPFDIKFRSLKDSLVNPIPEGMEDQGMYMCDWEKFGYPEQLHVGFNALLEYATAQGGQLPKLNSEEDANAILERAQKINDSNKQMDIEGAVKLEEVNKDLILNMSRYARANISPVASFWGGIIAQEIVKFTGKFTPLRQWLHYESFEALPENQVDRQPAQCRYDDMIAIFGKETMEKLSRSKVFMIGAGALGCELLKQSALMGLSVDKQGLFTVTDNDNIEISNLNRQFLFRKPDVSHSKSERASLAVQRMNPHFNVQSHKNLVSPETEDLFDDKFWNSLDFVINAVDNVKARLFVDGRCVWFGKALFESGTLGTKCNSQVIIPKQTQSYGDSQDPPEEGIPLCTLKNFPNQIEHCIQWARDYFEGIFVEGPNDAIKYIKNPTEFIQQQQLELKQKTGLLRGKLETVKKLAVAYLGGTYSHFVELARLMFEEIHHNQIAQLLYAFPLDHKTENGQLFWSGPKRPPTPLKFDINDPQHVEFVQATANIFANIFGLQFNNDAESVKQLIKNVNVPQFQPKKVAIKVDDKDTTEEKAEDDEEVAEKLANELKNLKISQSGALNPTEFEKDDPTNWHIEFVAAVANLRARNYSIKEVNKFQVKIIAGKIIPALATTTAMVVGAVGIEILKYVQGKKLDKMKNSFMNLALPLWLFSEPLPAIQTKDKEYDPIMMGPVKAIPNGFTTWDKIEIQGPKTIQQLIEHFETQYKVKPTIMSCGKLCVYNSYQPDNKERLAWDIGAAIEKVGQKSIPAYKVFLELEVSSETVEDGIDVVMPTVKYAYKG